jgi:hypothetical protein
MSLNTIGLVFISLVTLYFSYVGLNVTPSHSPSLPYSLVPQQVGKQKQIQSKNGDASMHTELNRRKTIIYGMSGKREKIKETRTSIGSTNGSLEAFFLTAIANPPILVDAPSIFQVCYSMFDAGNADNDYCYVLDGEDGEIVYDAGNADTLVCGV